MGTDIHMFCEVNRDGVWEFTVPEGFECEECKGTGTLVYGPQAQPQYVGKTHQCYWCHGKGKITTYDNRSYRTFAVLAGVRNGTGFAGVPTGDAITPISEPKGRPKKMSKKGRDWFRRHGGDHSDSWLTVAEIDAYMANIPEKRSFTGLIALSDVPEFLRDGKPRSWCGGVGGPSVQIFTLDQAKKILEENPDCAKPTEDMVFASDYVRVDWEESFRDTIDPAFFRYLDTLRPLAEDPANIRLVFNFDS
jgi:hypothetical protein